MAGWCVCFTYLFPWKIHSDEWDKGKPLQKKINWVKTFPTAFLRQPLSPSWSLLECVLLLLRFKFWHFEINRRQRDVFFFFTVSWSLGENTSIRPAEDLTQETEGSIHNEWSPTWGSTQGLSLFNQLKSSRHSHYIHWLVQLVKVHFVQNRKKDEEKNKTQADFVLWWRVLLLELFIYNSFKAQLETA